MLSNKLVSKCMGLAIICWLLPFLYRIIFIENINTIEETNETIVTKIYEALDSKNQKEAFLLIKKNNLQGCIINIS